MTDEDPELEELKRQVPPGWYLDAMDPTQQQYWDGSRWTDARRPLPSSSGQVAAGFSWPRIPPVVIVAVVIVAGWLFFYNTNPGKRVMAELGLRECYEVTLTGEVVCGEGADRIERLKESLR